MIMMMYVCFNFENNSFFISFRRSNSGGLPNESKHDFTNPASERFFRKHDTQLALSALRSRFSSHLRRESGGERSRDRRAAAGAAGPRDRRDVSSVLHAARRR